MLVIDKDKIYIYNYHEVLMMDCRLFQIQMQGYDLIVRGKDLQMSYYDEKEIRLCGYVKVIEYDENGV